MFFVVRPGMPDLVFKRKGEDKCEMKRKTIFLKVHQFRMFEGILAEVFCRGCKFFGSHGLIRDVEIYVSWLGGLQWVFD